METVKIEGKKYTFETSWDDVVYSRFVEIINATQQAEREGATTEDSMHSLSVRTLIPLDTLKKVSVHDLQTLADITSYANNVDELAPYCVVSNDLAETFQVRKSAYGKLEDAKVAISKVEGKSIHNAGVKVVQIYTTEYKDGKEVKPGMDISNEKVKTVYGLASFFLSRLQSFLTSTSG